MQLVRFFVLLHGWVTVADYHRVQRAGYAHPITGEWVNVPEMNAEIVVPTNYEGSKLRPYVSYRTDAEVSRRMSIAKDDDGERVAK